MQFSAYSDYKNSGVEWLGEVPSQWEVLKSKTLFGQSSKRALPNDEQLTASQKYGVIPQSLFMEKEEQKVVLALKGTENFKHIDKNDFVISLRSFQGGIELCHYSGCVSPAYTVLKPKLAIDKKYWAYLFKDNIYIQALNTAVIGIREGKNISYSNFGEILVPLPTVEEQNQIADFLDNETAKIDNLIAKQEQLIMLLEEQRKSVISHAVTKGLDPNAPMKDSGVEWLGEVPKHWEIVRFGKIFEENKRKNLGMKENNVLSLSYGNIKEKNIDDNKGLLPESFETYQIIEPNDIIFRFTDLQNDKRSLRNAISKFHGIITSAYISVKTKQNSDFYNYLFRAYDLQKVFYSMGDGMRQSLKMDELNKMPVILPKIEEQEKIVDFIHQENEKFDTLIQKQQQLINQLKEYRTSVISHAVTGKIKVTQ